jgi:hypothetical protein
MKKQIAVATLALALSLPAASVFADNNSRTKGTLIGAAAGALVTHSVGGAVVGGALGNGVAYASSHRRHRTYYTRNHHRYYHYDRY